MSNSACMTLAFWAACSSFLRFPVEHFCYRHCLTLLPGAYRQGRRDLYPKPKFFAARGQVRVRIGSSNRPLLSRTGPTSSGVTRNSGTLVQCTNIQIEPRSLSKAPAPPNSTLSFPLLLFVAVSRSLLYPPFSILSLPFFCLRDMPN